MTLTDWVVIAGAGAIGYGAVSFFLGRRAHPPQPQQAAPPAAPSDPPRAPDPASQPEPAQPGRSAWDEMQGRPPSEGPERRR